MAQPALDPAKKKQLAIMGLIYKKINDLLGAGNQLFSMQFPSQPLNYRQYQYDTDDRTSVLTRPYTIAEAEFRLSDQLFDVYPITAGSTGEKLSVVYDTLLNNYVPSLKPLAAYFKDRAGLSQFLRDPVVSNGDGSHKSRIDLCKELYNQYLQAKLGWEIDKNATFDEILSLSTEEDSGVSLDDYAKWLSSEGPVRQEELNQLYNDAVVKGHLHEVLTILGYLNVSSLAEQLELAKQRMRHSVRMSLDESMLIYPVQFQPSNWFQALAPNLSPVDLTMAYESIRDQLGAKRRELSRAESELRVLELLSTNEGEIKSLEESVNKAKDALSQAEGELVKKYGQATVSAAKMILSTFVPEGRLLQLSELDDEKTELLKDADGNQKKTIKVDDNILNALGIPSDEDIKKATQELYATYVAQKEALQKAEELTYIKAQLARAKSHDVRFQKINLEQRIKELHAHIEELGQLLAGVYRENQNFKGSVTVEQNKSDKQKWTIHLPGSPSKGTFKLTIQDKTTSTIAYNSDKSTLETVLNGLGLSVSGTAVTATVTVLPDASSWEITFSHEVGEISGDGSGLTVAQSTAELPVTPVGGTATEADGMFMDIVIKSSEIEQSASTVETASATQFGWNVNGWFFSAGGQHSSAQATTDAETAFFSQEIQIGLRVAKVTFDRGGWFNPQIFKMSHEFYRLTNLRAAPDSNELTKDKVLKAAAEEDNPTGKVAELLKDSEGNRSILPAYPVGMVIAKDITIKIKQDASQSKNTRTVLESSNAAGGGFLGFSCNYSSSSSSTSDQAFSGQRGDYFYIRIPGPQILGYYLQFVPPDKAKPYEAIFEEGKDTEIKKALAAYDSPPQLPQPNTKEQPSIELRTHSETEKPEAG